MNKVEDYNVTKIPVKNILPNPYQPRKSFNQIELDELCNSIKQFGVVQPISVRLISGNKYELIAGERRLRAAKMAKMENIPAIILKVNDKDSAVLALIENLQRENLNFFEEAEGYYNLINDYNLTQEEVAKQIGKSQSNIANKLRLLKLPEKIVKVIIDETLTERHARALLRLPTIELQCKVLADIVGNSLNVKETELLIDSMLKEISNEV